MVESIPDPGAPVRFAPISLLVVMAAGSTSPLALAPPIPGGPPPLGPAIDLGGPPNGDLSDGLTGWTWEGPSATLADGPVIVTGDNTTLLSPSFTVPAGAQSLEVMLGVPGADAVVSVRARLDDGGGDVALGTIVPHRAVRRFTVSIAQVAGRAVRIVLDPTTSLGRRVLVRSVGPVRTVLPGWSVTRGLPAVMSSWGHPAIRVSDDALQVDTPPIIPGAAARFLGVSVRGQGRLIASIGAHRVVATASGAAWRHLRVAVPAGAGSVVLGLKAEPSGEGLAVANAGVIVHQVAISALAVAAAGNRAVVRARVGPAAAGLQAQVRQGSRVVGRGRVSSRGTLVVRVAATGSRAVLEVRGDATRIGSRHAVSLPG